jgi:ribosome recycling factor
MNQGHRVTKELREKMTKIVATSGESAKKHIRDIRQKAIQACKDGIKELDVKRRSESELQKVYDKYNKMVDEVVAVKNKDLLG